MVLTCQIPCCAGHCVLPDGSVMFAGGSDYRHGRATPYGLVDSWRYLPETETWVEQPALNKERWYPGLLMLPNGDVWATVGTHATEDAYLHDQDLTLRVTQPGVEILCKGDWSQPKAQARWRLKWLPEKVQSPGQPLQAWYTRAFTIPSQADPAKGYLLFTSSLGSRLRARGEAVGWRAGPVTSDLAETLQDSVSGRDPLASHTGDPGPMERCSPRPGAARPSVPARAWPDCRHDLRFPLPSILLSDQDFPSIGFVAGALRRLGYQARLVKLSLAQQQKEGWLEAWRPYVTGEVQAAVISHALYGSGDLQPVQELLGLAQAAGAWTIVDVAQSAGVVPLSLPDWNPDFVVGTSLKWLCGGPGAGFLWANPRRLQETAPVDVGWFSHQDPFELDIHRFELATDARRFWGGTPSILPFMMAAASARTLSGFGSQAIRRHSLELTSILREGALSLGLPLVTPASEASRGGTLTLGLLQPEQARDQLRLRGISTDVRKGYGLRLSPHVYNTVEEMETVLQALSGLD